MASSEQSGTAAELSDGTDVELWRARESKLIEGITKIAKWNLHASRVHKVWHFSCTVIVTVCSVLAPLFIATSHSTILNFRNESANILIPLIITVLLGITEGLRRIFRFDQRWYTYYTSCNALVQAREIYLDKTVGLIPGSDKWKDLFFGLRIEAQALFNIQSKLYFQGILEQKELSESDVINIRRRKTNKKVENLASTSSDQAASNEIFRSKSATSSSARTNRSRPQDDL